MRTIERVTSSGSRFDQGFTIAIPHEERLISYSTFLCLGSVTISYKGLVSSNMKDPIGRYVDNYLGN